METYHYAESSSVFEGFTLTGAYALQGDSPTRLWKQGYQSWWWSGVTALFIDGF